MTCINAHRNSDHQMSNLTQDKTNLLKQDSFFRYVVCVNAFTLLLLSTSMLFTFLRSGFSQTVIHGSRYRLLQKSNHKLICGDCDSMELMQSNVISKIIICDTINSSMVINLSLFIVINNPLFSDLHGPLIGTQWSQHCMVGCFILC